MNDHDDHRCSSRGPDYKEPPQALFSRPPPPSILFMTPPSPENPLNNVLVQQMFAKMKNFAAYAGIKYTFGGLHIFKLCKEKIGACGGNAVQTLTAVNNPCFIHLVDTFT